MMDAEVRTSQTVVVRDGWITAVGPTGQATYPAGATVVDGAGRFLIPGLSDMHAHVYSEAELLLYVAHGVTRIRNMWGSHTALAMRARSDSGVVRARRGSRDERSTSGPSPRRPGPATSLPAGHASCERPGMSREARIPAARARSKSMSSATPCSGRSP